jgi:hypothetical protein
MPSPATPKLRDLAQRLLAHEAAEGKAADGNAPTVFRVCEKLRRPFCALVGIVGFRSLLARAFTLAKAEDPRLNTVQIKTDGSLEFSGESLPQPDPDDVAQGGIVLIAQLFGLLVIFIGESLTRRLMQEIWPDVFGDSDFKRENHE